MSKENVKEQEKEQQEVVDQQTEEQQETASEGDSFEEKFKEVNDKYLRLYSDFENYRKRSAKEKIDLINNASEGIMRELLAVMDDFERAITNNKNSDDIDSVKEGFELIHHKFKHILTQKGLKPMDAKGKDFDTDLHEAVTNIPAPEKKLVGKVVDVAEKGYFLNDKVLRFAKVIVGQ